MGAILTICINFERCVPTGPGSTWDHRYWPPLSERYSDKCSTLPYYIPIWIRAQSGSFPGWPEQTTCVSCCFWILECLYSGCQKNVLLFKRFFYNHLYRNSLFRNIIMESGIKALSTNARRLPWILPKSTCPPRRRLVHQPSNHNPPDPPLPNDQEPSIPPAA